MCVPGELLPLRKEGYGHAGFTSYSRDPYIVCIFTKLYSVKNFKAYPKKSTRNVWQSTTTWHCGQESPFSMLNLAPLVLKIWTVNAPPCLPWSVMVTPSPPACWGGAGRVQVVKSRWSSKTLGRVLNHLGTLFLVYKHQFEFTSVTYYLEVPWGHLVQTA